MPTWEARLSPLDRKILALYLFDLRRERTMSGAGAATKHVKPKSAFWLLIGAGLLLVLIANSHLVYVADHVAAGMRRRICAKAKAPRSRDSSVRHVVMHAAN